MRRSAGATEKSRWISSAVSARRLSRGAVSIGLRRFRGSSLRYSRLTHQSQNAVKVSSRLARVFPEIEVSPQSAFWIAAQKGEEKSSELEIINHGASPLRIENVSYRKERFRTSLKTVEDGRRFRLTLTLDPAGPAAKTREAITIPTNSKKMPLLTIAVNINVRERVYTFPEAVQLGALPLSFIEKNSGAVEQLAQTLVIF